MSGNKITIEDESNRFIVDNGIVIADFKSIDDGIICPCGRSAAFFVSIHGVQLKLCEECIVNLGKCILEALK